MQVQQSTPLKSSPNSPKQPMDGSHSKGSPVFGNLVASFIVSFRRIGVFFPIIAFFMTLVFYFYYGSLVNPLITLYWKGADGGFLILTAGFFCAFVIVLIYAFCSAPFVTSANKGLQDYDFLETSERKLRNYFGIRESEREIPAILEDDMIDRIAIPNLKQDTPKINALKQAYTTYLALYKRLYFPQGRQLLSNTGDLYAWGMAYRTEEALTAIKTTPTVFREAVLDYSIIRNSPMDDRDELLEQLTRAIKNFGPQAREYLKDLESDKKLASMQEDIQKLQKALENKDITSKSSSPPTQEEQTPDQNNADTSQPDSETFARATICSVKERLHKFQESSLAGILQARNNLILSTVASGIITYAFLFLTIASILTPQADNRFTVALASAVTLYVIGIAAGLFGRLYAEANRTSAINDYGLSQARLQAIPLISGLAAIGGLFITTTALSPTNGSVELMNIFTLNVHSMLVALIFGFTPNLLIRNLQQGADRYVSELESTRKKG